MKETEPTVVAEAGPGRLRYLPWLAVAVVAVAAAGAWAWGGLPAAAALCAVAAAVLTAAAGTVARRRCETVLGAEIERRQQGEYAALAADRAKRDFLANMSHELRTPLNAILGTTDLLLADERTASRRESLRLIMSSAEILLALIEDLLDYAELEAGKLRLETADFELRGLVDGVVEMLGPRAAERGLELTVEVDPALPEGLHGDAVRLRQVLFDLADNAVKFTRRGSVALHVAREGAEVRFTVRDTGIGISPADQKRIFGLFAQADSSSAREFGGTGLGLAVARQLVELMGGTIELASVRGEGSTFSFRLPLAAASAPEATGPGRRPAAPETYRVLVVDDNLTNRKLATSHLAALGFCAAEAADGEEALAQLAAERFDAVLMDCAMPELDGYETTRRLRRAEAQSSRPRVVVIAVTAHTTPGEREKCLAVGMDDYLAKPYRGRELRAVLGRWLAVAPADDEAPDDEAPAAPASPDAGRATLDRARLDALRRLGEKTGNDVLGETIRNYLQESEALVAALRRALGAGDAATLRQAAHSLVGSSAMLGAEALVRCCRAVEERAYGGDAEGCREDVAAAVAEHHRVTAALRSEAQASSSDASPERRA